MYKRMLLCSVLSVAVIGITTSAAQAQQKAGQATFGNLIAALNNIAVQIGNLEVIDDVTIGDVTVVDASNLLQGARINALNNALNRNNVEILNLRNVLNNNEVIKNALNDVNVNVNDVIAVNVLSGGDLIIFR